MPRVSANGLFFEYETFGDPGARPLLLVMGLGAQMIGWHEDFCRLLASRGFHVIRFDNRDCGLSSKLDHLGIPDPMAVLQGLVAPPYTLGDMATDAACLLDALGIAAAHVVGASMGGFIAQLMAIDHPHRVLSLTSIMSAPGSTAENVPGRPEVTAALLAKPPVAKGDLIEHLVWVGRMVSGPLFDEQEMRQRVALAVDRDFSPAGTTRQLAAIVAAPSRTRALGRVRVPTLVVHGEVDPLIPVENGRRTAAAVPGARLLTLPRMGHDLPRPYWPQIVEAIAEVARAAESTRD